MEEIGNNYYIIVKPNNLNLVRMIYVNNRHNCYFYNYIYILSIFLRETNIINLNFYTAEIGHFFYKLEILIKRNLVLLGFG